MNFASFALLGAAKTNVYEMISFVAYFLLVLSVGIFFFFKGRKDQSEKGYFLGGRNMGGMVAALSAGASDMSAWVLMGLPGAIALYGLGQVWISIGLLIGTVCAWIFVAPRLRRFAIVADDAITVPQFLSNRFKAKNPTLRISCAVIFVVAYCIYAASSIVACGDLFSTVIPAVDKKTAMIIAASVIVVYTLLGGFNAVCWTDFFQGMLMLAALLAVPLVAVGFMKVNGAPSAPLTDPANYYNFLSSGSLDWKSVSDILTGLGWGLGYFGMPHILVRYMAIKNDKEMKRSQIMGIIWITLILGMATMVGLVAHKFLGGELNGSNSSLAFIKMIRYLFKYGAVALIGGLLLSAIVAASMSTADSQLLASSSSFASDIYKTTIRKKASDKEMMWVGRFAVLAVTIIALIIAMVPQLSNIMTLVSAAWSIFGASFGPAILLALFWKRFNYKGACAGIITGFAVSVLWMVLFNLEYYGFTSVIYGTNLYEIVPGFLVGLAVAVTVTLLTKKPSEEIQAMFEKVENFKDEDYEEGATAVTEE